MSKYSIYDKIIKDLSEYNPENIDINNISELVDWAYKRGLQNGNNEAVNEVKIALDDLDNKFGDYLFDKFKSKA